MTYKKILLAAITCLSAAAPAQAVYPDRPVKIVNGFAPGGGSDILLRAIVPAISEKLGQPLVIDYKVGAGGNVAIDTVARATPERLHRAGNVGGELLAWLVAWAAAGGGAPESITVQPQFGHAYASWEVLS